MDATGSSPDTTETAHGKSPNVPATEAPPIQRKAGKRDRVALACQRCKTRKQKVAFSPHQCNPSLAQG
ncbi:fungal-specific transcription factor domain-containing protein [Apiospora arundinis]